MVALGILFSLVCIAAALIVAVTTGAAAYAGWRSDQRRALMRDPVARHFYAEYRSPFPWHRLTATLKAVKKDSAA